MKINVIGLGYIGLPTALMFASCGHEVIGTDLSERLVNTLKSGKTTFEEKGLDELFRQALPNISFTLRPSSTSEVYIIAVATPYDEFSKKVDATYVCSAVKDVLSYCGKNSIIVIESTVSPGTIKDFVEPIIADHGFVLGKDVFLAHAPERIIPGNMIFELQHNSRTVGCDDAMAGKIVCDLYSTITSGEVVLTSVKTAEMTKVIENTFRAVNIAFANELAKICDHAGMNVYDVIRICNMHPRVNILQPGPGVGGHCISVDPWFLVGDYPALTKVIWDSLIVNQSMPEYVLNKALKIAKENGINDFARIGIYGLTYKENVDDTRESPSIQLLDAQAAHLANPLKSFDPFVKRPIVPNQCLDFQEFLDDVDMVIVMVKHSHIIEHADALKGKIVFDTQNILSGDHVYKL